MAPPSAVSPLPMGGGGRSSVAPRGRSAADADDVESEEDLKPKPTRKTVTRLMAQGLRAQNKLDLEKKAREEEEPICRFVSMETALKLKEVATSLSKQIPQDMGEIRMSRLRAPKTSTQATLKQGGSVEQAATHAALKALEEWVRILRPFASGQELGLLIKNIVHQKEDPYAHFRETLAVEVIPPIDDPLGSAIRRLVPEPGSGKWEWIEDLLEAMSFEENFDRSCFVHRSSTPSATMRQTEEALMMSPARPATTGRLSNKPPRSPAARMRLSGPVIWDAFEKDSGFRSCKSTGSTDKYVKSIPGPAVYGDFVRKMEIPRNVSMSVFPSVGCRRTLCTTNPYSHLDRFFAQNFGLE